jgi:pyruvate kinase
VETLSCVLAICGEAERLFHHSRFFHSLMDATGAFDDAPGGGLSARESMASTLVRVAEKTGAKLIVIFTRSGRHAAAVAKWRPNVPILALFPPTLRGDGVRWAIGGRAECRSALLRRGVLPMLADPRDGLSEDAMLRSALAFAEHAAGLVRPGDVVAVSHKLRDDISISVLHVGDEGDCAPGAGRLSESGAVARAGAAA